MGTEIHPDDISSFLNSDNITRLAVGNITWQGASALWNRMTGPSTPGAPRTVMQNVFHWGGRAFGAGFGVVDLAYAGTSTVNAVTAYNQGYTERATARGVSAALYAAAGTVGVLSAANIWNPGGWFGAVATIGLTGAAMATEAAYDFGWFGLGNAERAHEAASNLIRNLPTPAQVNDPNFRNQLRNALDPDGTLRNVEALVNAVRQSNGQVNDAVLAAVGHLTDNQRALLMEPPARREVINANVDAAKTAILEALRNPDARQALAANNNIAHNDFLRDFLRNPSHYQDNIQNLNLSDLRVLRDAVRALPPAPERHSEVTPSVVPQRVADITPDPQRARMPLNGALATPVNETEQPAVAVARQPVAPRASAPSIAV